MIVRRKAGQAEAYRYPNENIILTFTLLPVFGVIALTALATVCSSVLFVALAVVIAYSSSRAHHHTLMEAAHPVSASGTPELSTLVQECANRLHPGPVEVYVTPSRGLNAYTFGLELPKVLVLYSV